MSHEFEPGTPEDAANFSMPDTSRAHVSPAVSPEVSTTPAEVNALPMAPETVEEAALDASPVSEQPVEAPVTTPEGPQESNAELADTLKEIDRAGAELTDTAQTLETSALGFLDAAEDDFRIINGRVGELNPRDRISQQTIDLAEQSMPHMRHLAEGMRELYGDVKSRVTRFNENATQLAAQLGNEQNPDTQAQLKAALHEEINTFRADLDMFSQEVGNRYIQLSGAAERMGESFVQHRARSGRFLEEYSGGRQDIREHPIAPIVFKVTQFADNMAQERLRARVAFQEFSENTIAKYGGLARSLEG